jgi:dolichol-phosphate mannosyltransferase
MPTSPRFREFPYVFRCRHSGASKLDALVVWEHVVLVLAKLVGHLVPVRFIMFSLIGNVGIAVHVFTLWLRHRVVDLGFLPAQSVATMVVMTGTSSRTTIGVVANVGIDTVIFRREYTWWIAGVAGCIVGAVLSFAVTALLTWRDRR